MRVIGHNIVFKSLPNEEVNPEPPHHRSDTGLEIPVKFQYTDSDKKEMKFHKGEVIDTGEDVTFMKKGDVFYYDNNRAYATVVNGETVNITQSPFVILVLDSDD
jgi:hypothetical protein